MAESKDIRLELAKPFPASDVEWRLQNLTKDKSRGMAVPYIDSRATQNRLDEVVGPFRWQTKFIAWHPNGQKASQLCALSIFDESRGEWITKCDGAEDTDFEPIKGGISDSFKRAAVLWGIGRYLYAMDTFWVDAEAAGNSFRIPEREQKRLDSIYEKEVTRIFGTPPPKPAAAKPGAAQPAAKPPIQFDYAVKKAKAQQFKSGNGFVLSLAPAKKGAEVIAYLQGEHPDIAEGVCLRNVKLSTMPGAAEGSTINIIQDYEIAA